MKLHHGPSYIFSLCVIMMCSVLTACSGGSEQSEPNEYTKAVNLLNDSWITDCLVNPAPDSDPDFPVGYFRETLQIDTFTAVQTFEYFEDPNCSVRVSDNRVANPEESLFLTKQSQVLSVSYPAGETSTDIGIGYFLDLEVISVSIDDMVLTEEEMQQLGITLTELSALFVITESERLHLSTGNPDTRPTTVPADYFYTKSS